MRRIVNPWPVLEVVASAALAFMLAFFASPGLAREGVCLATPMDFADKSVSGCLQPSDADALMDRRVRLGGNRGDGGVLLSHPTDSAKRREVHTCREYEAAIRDGWFALSTADMTMESFFKRECGLLHALGRAKSARASFIDAPSVGVANLDLISARAVSALVPDGSGSIKSLIDAGKLKVEAHGAREVRLFAAGLTADLREIARGDFDGDGLEDVFALLAVHAQGGTMRSYDTMLLTRKSAGGMFEVTPLSIDG